MAGQQRFDRNRVDAQAHRSGNEVDRTFRCRRGFAGPEDVDTDEADDDPDPPQQRDSLPQDRGRQHHRDERCGVDDRRSSADR